MKSFKVLLIIVLLTNLSITKAQVVAEVPTLEAIVLDQGIEDKVYKSKEMVQIIQQTKYLLEAKEELEKVSNHVSNAKMVKNIVEEQYELYELLSNSVQVAKRQDFDLDVLNNLLEDVEDILDKTDSNKEILRKLLSSYQFNMNDAERLTFLKDISNDIKQMKADIYFSMAKAERYDKLLKLYSK